MKLLVCRLICATLLAACSSRAQMLSVTPTGLSPAMMHLFGSIGGFSSQADVRMLDKSNGESVSVPLAFSMLDGKVRAEIDMSQVKGKEMPPEAAASLKLVGLDKLVSILRPDKKMTIVVYPALRSYAEAPMSSRDAADADRKYTIQTSKIGKETLDGHSCQKNRVTIAADNGRKHEAIVWNATDLQQFPLQIQMKQEEGNIVMHFTKVQLVKPDAKLFEAPAGFTKQPSVEKLMEDAVLKVIGK